MPKGESVTARTVYNCSVGRFHEAEKSDLLILTLRVGNQKLSTDEWVEYEDLTFALDRKVAEHLKSGLEIAIPKLLAPGTGH